MKKLIVFTLCFIATVIINAQNAQIYFSNQPFEMGKEDQNEMKTEFTDEDDIYGLAVIDKEIVDNCKQTEKWLEPFSAKVMYFTGTSYGVKNCSFSSYEVQNGKTYIFFDIAPEISNAKSRDVKSWVEFLIGTPVGKKGKIIIKEIEGDQCFKMDPIKVKNGQFTFNRKSGKTNNELIEKSKLIFSKVDKMRDEARNSGRADEIARLDEENKKTGKLPNVFYNNKWKSIPLSNYTQEEFTEKVKACNAYNDGETYLMYGHDWTETKYVDGKVDHTAIQFYLIVKDKEGNCVFRKVWASQFYENGKYTEPVIYKPEEYGVHDSKKGFKTSYFNCDELPK